MNQLIKYGLNDRFSTEATLYPDLELGRIISQSKDLYKVVTKESELLAEVSGKFRYETKYLCDFPAVGDFVMLDRSSDLSGNAIIHQVLTRKSSFERTAVGMKNQSQVVASNIDYVFICMSLNNDYNLRRLERYLSIAWESRATPVIILTKADLCDDIKQKLLEISTVAFDVEVIITSMFDRESSKQLSPYLRDGITSSFIGSSGVGKSTLVNCLLDEEHFLTSETRKDDKGRHTTTRRELLLLPQGGIVIDTPGMRELGVDSVDLSKAFVDIDTLSQQCRFHNCSHTTEPGCAIKAAIEAGQLDSKRLESYFKLKKEASYDGLSSKQIETEKMNSMFSEFGGVKNARKYLKEKSRKKY